MSANHTDPSQNIVAAPIQPLDAVFKPKTVAVIGAKDDLGAVGRTIMANLLSGTFNGAIYPVNPKRSEVMGITCYPDISAIPKQVDLAIIITPAKTVPAIVKQCVANKVKSAIIISAGFKEVGPEGLAMENEIVATARSGNMPIIGPNCLGVMNPIYGLNATFAKGMALPGNVAFISQSGAMCTAVLDWSFKAGIGFSSFVSIGSMADVNWGDLIHYLGDDPQTHSILMYMETVGNPRAFLTAAREIALEKPIIVIKAGRSPQAAKAAASHTGSLAGSDEVFDAALLRAGVLRVDTISELFDMASVLSRQPLPKGPNLSIITNAGGPSVLATDTAVLNGAKLTKLDDKTYQALNSTLPQAWSHGNPVDILGDAQADRYVNAVDILAQDSNTDGILVVLSPQDMTDAVGTAECLRPYARLTDKPILASWMGGDAVSQGVQILGHANIPTFSYPDDAAWSFAKMWSYSENLHSLYETPSIRDDITEDTAILPQHREAKALIDKARSEGRTLLDEDESKKVLKCYGIPVVETVTATSAEEAAARADSLGYPVVAKLYSQTITHKTDVGGVILNLESANEVRHAFEKIRHSVTEAAGAAAFEGVTVQRMVKLDGYELILGSSCDEQFGPVLLFGTGGQLVEVYKDRSLALPPLNSNLAAKLINKTKIADALRGVRGRSAIDMVNLKRILVHFSQMIVENRWIKECDINPLLASTEEIVALDARIVLHDPSLKESELPEPAIRPYPIEYINSYTLNNGIAVTIRPIRPEDEPQIADFQRKLSEESARQRYFDFVNLDSLITHERLVRLCFNDYDREIALIAEDDSNTIIGAARLIKIPGTKEADLKMIIADNIHNQGLGTQMLSQLVAIAKKEDIQQIRAAILSENSGMIHICNKLGFKIQTGPDPHITYTQLNVATR
ncbi:MAG: bifunctional acetate--CoA ligase family protein/GNAT family N-acetyltransferase [Chlamydiales bacterium]|nr:bifunctional acetate--CoA ligase family protein/GNAT family N-acetyltransferase [Chlamydiia bacterium]MCP5507397.1 bifunctional acetate--CoA ligase family protein/GNAT family N-acetyltransferase [Chlamydiales bacterium]